MEMKMKLVALISEHLYIAHTVKMPATISARFLFSRERTVFIYLFNWNDEMVFTWESNLALGMKCFVFIQARRLTKPIYLTLTIEQNTLRTSYDICLPHRVPLMLNSQSKYIFLQTENNNNGMMPSEWIFHCLLSPKISSKTITFRLPILPIAIGYINWTKWQRKKFFF